MKRQSALLNKDIKAEKETSCVDNFKYFSYNNTKKPIILVAWKATSKEIEQSLSIYLSGSKLIYGCHNQGKYDKRESMIDTRNTSVN